jgi:hypothetical protein
MGVIGLYSISALLCVALCTGLFLVHKTATSCDLPVTQAAFPLL